MTERYHAIPRDLFDALATGGGGTEAIGVLAAAERSKHATLLRGVLAAAERAEADQARCARLGWEVLDEIDRLDQDAAARVMTYPAVGAGHPHLERARRGWQGARTRIRAVGGGSGGGRDAVRP